VLPAATQMSAKTTSRESLALLIYLVQKIG
jgi:hypothetical protein